MCNVILVRELATSTFTLKVLPEQRAESLNLPIRRQEELEECVSKEHFARLAVKAGGWPQQPGSLAAVIENRVSPSE